jgi:hypothetical protein
MSESKFTPGPWRLGFVTRAYEVARRKIVAAEESPESGTGICEVYGIQDDDCVANAQLIAAAPDLLAACEAFVEADCQDGASLAFSMAVDAIAKAKVVV